MAIVDAYNDPNAESDLAVYRAQFGLPPCTTANGCFKKVSQTGSTGGTSTGATTGSSTSSGGGNTCSHDICVVGTRLIKTCDACATTICNSDSYCCTTKWDSQCVSEVASFCGQSCN